MRISDWSSDVCSSDLVAADDQRAKNGLTQGGFSAWRDLPTDEQIAVHIQDIALNLFVSDVTKEDAVNNSIPAASSTNGSIDPNVVDGMQALRTGSGLMRASQLKIGSASCRKRVCPYV